jgi:hypothetical protein
METMNNPALKQASFSNSREGTVRNFNDSFGTKNAFSQNPKTMKQNYQAKNNSNARLAIVNTKLFTFLTLALLLALNIGNGWGQVTVSTNTLSGNFTWICPPGVTSVTVECWGAGGRGGTRISNGSGGGGGGGAYSRSVIAVTPGVTYLLTAGAGSTLTTAGGDSYFGNTVAGNSSGSLVLAKGGNSAADNSTTGATGGDAGSGIGIVKFSGGSGWTTTTTGGGGGGSSAGTGSNGTNATSTSGETAPTGGGNGGNGRTSSQGNGVAGTAPGGGGGGGYRTSFSTRTGGTGGVGRVSITYTCSSAAIPWTEGFETGYTNNASMGGCWSQSSIAGAQSWIANSSATSYNRTPRTGSFNAFLQYSNDDWLFYPVQLTGGTNYTFEVYARQDGATSTDANITLAYGSNASSASMTTIIGPTGIINGNYQSINGTFTPATSGVYYMGIKGFMNDIPYYISIDDISVTVTPSCAAQPSALTSSITSSTTATLSWTAASPAPGSGYEIYYSTSSTAPVAGTAATTTTAAGVVTKSITGLTANTTYYWWVRSNCNGTDKGSWVSGGTFYTGYCLPPATTTPCTYNLISNVSLNTLSNNTGGCTGGTSYNSFPVSGSTTTSLVSGTGYTLNVTLGGTSSTSQVAYWIDWNNNLIFETSEFTYVGNTYASGSIASSTINVPIGTSPNNYGIRIKTDWVSSTTIASSSACSVLGYGETEDYTFTVVAPCTAPSAQASSITASSITNSSADIGWTIGNGVGRVVYVNTTNSFTAPTNGTTPTANAVYASGQQCVFNGSTSGPVTVTGLATNTTYWVRVYEYCTSGNTYQTAIATGNENSFTTAAACVVSGNPATYGNGSWIGYVYNSSAAGGFDSYQGFVTESEQFNRTHATIAAGASASHCSSNTNLFAIRYRMTKNFTAGYYTFTVGGDDGVRLSLDGGATWHINNWVDQGYTTSSSSSAVYLTGNTDLVFEYYENSGDAQSSFSYTYSANSLVPASGNNAYTLCSGTLYDHAGPSANYTNNVSGYTVLYPGVVGNFIQVSGTSGGETCCDWIRIYNGVGLGGTLLWSGNPGSVTIPLTTSTSGPLTIQFTSDGSFGGSGFALTVACLGPCSGTPAPGNTLTSSATVGAPSGTVNLSLSTPPVGTGLTYQWQSSTTSSTAGFSNISGATSATYAPTVSATTWYQCLVTCSGSTGTATPVQVTLTACIPTTVYGCTDGDVIARVILNTLDNNSGTGCPSGVAGYSNYTSNPALTTTLLPSSTYNCTVYAGQYSEGYAAWIDYNDDLVFDNVTERIGYSNGQVAGSGAAGVLGSSAVFPITLACTPPAGNHILRVRAMYFTNGVDVTPCTGNSYGEVEDYMITISAAPACASPGLMTTITPAANSATLTWATNCSAATNYDFQYGPAGFALGTGTILTNQAVTIAAPNASFNLTGLAGGTAYTVYYRANCGGGVTSEWSIANNFSTLAVWTNAWVSMNTGDAVWCPGETRVVTVTVTNTGNMTWTNATPDINIGVKWNAEADYFVRTDANGLAPGASQTYSLTMTAPLVLGANNLTFDIVNEGPFWFASNANGAGPGNVVYTSPTITISSPTVSAGAAMVAICQGTASAALGGSFGGTATAAVWSGGAGTFANNTGSTPETATYTSTASETGTITLTLTTSGGPCGTVFATKTIDVNANLPASVSIAASASTICAGTSVTFTATPTNGGAAPAYQWKVNGANVGANSTTFISTTLANNDVVTCVLTSNASPCLSGSPATSNSQTITVNQPSTNISVVNGVNIADGDYLWNGNTSNDGSEASNWYILNNGIYSVASIPPSQTDEVFIINYNNTGTCVSSQNSANIPASGTFTSGNIYLGSDASMSLGSSSTLNVSGNFINDGFFTPGTGTVNMNGTSAQSIGGSASTTFNNLTINNAAGVSLNRAVDVSGILTLTSGRLSLGSNNLTLGTSASIGGVPYSATNMVVAAGSGELRKRFTSGTTDPLPFTFPIGTIADGNEYTPVILDFGSSTFGAAAYVGAKVSNVRNGSMMNTITNYIDRNWVVEPNDIPSYLYEIKLYYTDNDLILSGMSEGDIKPVKLSAGQWYQCDDIDATFTNAIKQGSGFINATNNYLVWGGLSTFSEFGGAGGSNQPLPVELLSFNGTCNEGMVNLVWQTASEFNSSHFDVEKSTDGETWRVLATIPSAGTSNELLTYQTVDNNGTQGNNYYRLRQVDIDGKEKLYDPINVSCVETTTGYFTSYPNPSGNEFQVVVNNKEILGACTLNIVDAQGKVIEQRDIEVKDGINMFVINQELTPGMYFLNISNGSKSTPVLRHAIK